MSIGDLKFSDTGRPKDEVIERVCREFLTRLAAHFGWRPEIVEVTLFAGEFRELERIAQQAPSLVRQIHGARVEVITEMGPVVFVVRRKTGDT